MAAVLKERVASEAYASESEIIREGPRALFSREDAVQQWLRTEVVAAYDDLRADPSRAISPEGMRIHLAALHEQRLEDHGSWHDQLSARPGWQQLFVLSSGVAELTFSRSSRRVYFRYPCR